jgi:hypothetical protein
VRALLRVLVPPAFLLPALLAQKHQVGDDWKMEDRETIQKTFNVSTGSNPKKVLVDNISGAIHVHGYGGAEVQMTAQRHTRAESKEALEEAKRDVKLDVSQQGNYVRLYEDGPFRDQNGTNFRGDRYYGYNVNFDYELQVPYGTELILKTINHGDVSIENTTANFEVRNINGAISLDRVSGSGSVNTINGPVTVHFAKNPAEISSFKTLNGQVDIWFQPGLSADLRFKTFNGHIYTDFDVTALPVPAGQTENKNGLFVYKSDRNSMGRVGRGGPELSFDAFNGNIRLHTK